jgi:regulator of protease activity HflC (stomatin/prohibitin superfamily)
MFKGSLNIVAGVIAVFTVILAMVTFFAFGKGDYGLGACAVVAVIGLIVTLSPRMIQEWDRGVLLRLGRFRGVLEPGITWIVPGVDMLTSLVDMRIRSTDFAAEKTLTHDTVPVNVDAVMFWVVTDAKKAVLEVEYFEQTINLAAQTTLRDVIGKTELMQMISDRETLDEELLSVIDAKTSEWGITVQSVEIRDVRIPGALEDAMSRKAQAEREQEARVILAQSEVRVAAEMDKAAAVYRKQPEAMKLRAMNMTYESIKERGALMVVPTGMAESLNSGVIGMAAAGFRLDESDPAGDES